MSLGPTPPQCVEKGRCDGGGTSARRPFLRLVVVIVGTAAPATRCGAMDSKTHDEPSEVAAEDGVVYVDGPDGVAVALTPEAAIETSHRLLDGGLSAHGQNVLKADVADKQ